MHGIYHNTGIEFVEGLKPGTGIRQHGITIYSKHYFLTPKNMNILLYRLETLEAKVSQKSVRGDCPLPHKRQTQVENEHYSTVGGLIR